MINNANEIIIGVLAPVIESQKFVKQGDECVYVNKTHAFKIEYDESRHVYTLDMAKLVENGEAEFYNVSSYLFDDRSDERDAKSVGGDFLDCINNELGIQRSASLRRKDVALPSKAAADATPGIEAFCNRFLTLYPAYKDKYKDDVAKYNGFMYDNFFSTVGVEMLENVIGSQDKKQFCKYINMLDEFYVDGDNDVQSTIMYSIIGEAFRKDSNLCGCFSKICEENGAGQHLVKPAENMYKFVISKNK